MSAPWGPVAAGPSALVRSGQASTIEPFQRENDTTDTDA